MLRAVAEGLIDAELETVSRRRGHPTVDAIPAARPEIDPEDAETGPHGEALREGIPLDRAGVHREVSFVPRGGEPRSAEQGRGGGRPVVRDGPDHEHRLARVELAVLRGELGADEARGVLVHLLSHAHAALGFELSIMKGRVGHRWFLGKGGAGSRGE